METTHFKKIACVSLALLLLMMGVGCKKMSPVEEKETDTTAARDDAESQSVFSGIWKQVAEVGENFKILNGSCTKVTITPLDTITWPKTVVIDFGSVNCLGFDGVYRRGIITAKFSGRYRKAGTVIESTLTNFYHNNNLVQGTQTITNNGLNSGGNITYTVVVNNASVTTTKGVMTWSTQQTREWIMGATTPYNTLDDVYLINGTTNGVGLNGNSYNIMITLPLRVETNCRWIVSGVLALKSAKNLPLLLNYGEGTCDNSATATINGKTHLITLY
ncbi:MAG: hypothetical protein ABI315_01170 [Bacteroidia bacterium]